MTVATVAPSCEAVTVGVDTHSDVHVAVVLDQLGRRLDTGTFPATSAGYVALEQWAQQHGEVACFGIEGTGSWAAGLSRHLRRRGHRLVEVSRPDRGARRRQGKSDPLDAEAARAVLAGIATAAPKAGNGRVEMIRALQVARRSAQKARSQAANQLRSLLVTAPAQLREELRSARLAELVRAADRWRPGAEPDTHLTVSQQHAMRSLARRYEQLTEEIRDLDKHLSRLVTAAAPALIAVKGLGPSPARRY